MGASVPVRRQRSTSSITQLALTPNRRAVAGFAAPPSTAFPGLARRSSG
ncbi:MAG: hypothetical protein IT564_08955 [Rhodospirillales bacterium]|nr:hypothetical protein [Rhodospirillales bacterium]